MLMLLQGAGPACNGQPLARGVSKQEIQQILEVHNRYVWYSMISKDIIEVARYRSLIARGEERRGKPGPQPGAADMKQMVSRGSWLVSDCRMMRWWYANIKTMTCGYHVIYCYAASDSWDTAHYRLRLEEDEYEMLLCVPWNVIFFCLRIHTDNSVMAHTGLSNNETDSLWQPGGCG